MGLETLRALSTELEKAAGDASVAGGAVERALADLKACLQPPC
jgi:hypothetical protein